MASEISQSTSASFSSSMPISGVIDILNGSGFENGSGVENGGSSLTGDSSHKQVHDTSDDTSVNTNLSNTDASDNVHEFETGKEFDNDSLFKTFHSQSAKGMLPLKSMLKDLLEGFNHQLRLEIKSDMKQLLETNKHELSEFKSQIDTRISNVDCKFDSKLADVNQKIDAILDRESLSEKMAKIDGAIAANNSLSENLNDHIKSTESLFEERKSKETELIKSIDFLNKEVHDLRKTNESLIQKNASLEIKIENQGTFGKRLKSQVNTLCVEKTASEVRQRKLNLVFEGLAESPNDNPKQLVIDLLQKSGDLPNATDISLAYRLGKATESNNRPILVSFHNQLIKDNILKRASKIKLSSGNPSL